MSDKIKISLLQAANLQAALAKLAALNVHSGINAYGLMQVEDVVNLAVPAYRETLVKRLQAHGAHSNLEGLRATIAKLQAQGAAAAAALAEQEAQLRQWLPKESFSLTPEDPGYAAYLAEAQELGAKPIELALTARVPVAVAALPDGYFSPAEMRVLQPLVEFIV